jgi:hypothetical protein
VGRDLRAAAVIVLLETAIVFAGLLDVHQTGTPIPWRPDFLRR